MLSWAQFAWLLSRRVGELPNLTAKISVFAEAPLYQPKNEAARGISEALDPLLTDFDSLQVQAMASMTEAEAEAALVDALVAAEGDAVSALAFGDRLRGIFDTLRKAKDLYEKIQPWLGLIGAPLPPLPSLPLSATRIVTDACMENGELKLTYAECHAPMVAIA